MCWVSDKAEYQKKRIANENIEVFKIVENICDDHFKSIYQWFRYVIGNEYEQEIENEERDVFINLNRSTTEKVFTRLLISKGLHSYSSKDVEIYSTGKYIEVIGRNRVNDSIFIKNHANMYKLNCIIPKGSEYYENEYSEITKNKRIKTSQIT